MANETTPPLREHITQIRVRFQETDAQGRLHHANFINFFEIGRIEFLRAIGHSYRQLEADGLMLVVTEVECQYFRAARYDDLLQLRTRIHRARGVRIEHHYELTLEGELVAAGRTVIACLDRDGKVCRLPKFLQLDEK